jgi:hypothetical protein
VLWVELSSEVRTRLVNETFVTAIVEVGEEFSVVVTEGSCVNVISVVLGGNVTLSCGMIDHRLVLSSVTKGELLRLTTSGKTHKLIPQTDTENGFDFAIGN